MSRLALALTVALAAAPALAEPSRLSLVIGADSLDAESADILETRRTDEAGGPALHIRLADRFDAEILEITSAHVGETAELRLCGQTVLAPVIQTPIPQAVFVIADPDPKRIDELAALIAAPDCGTAP